MCVKREISALNPWKSGFCGLFLIIILCKINTKLSKMWVMWSFLIKILCKTFVAKESTQDFYQVVFCAFVNHALYIPLLRAHFNFLLQYWLLFTLFLQFILTNSVSISLFSILRFDSWRPSCMFRNTLPAFRVLYVVISPALLVISIFDSTICASFLLIHVWFYNYNWNYIKSLRLARGRWQRLCPGTNWDQIQVRLYV